MTVVVNNQSALQAPSTISVAELDGTPSVANVSTLKLTNGTLTNNGDGSVSISVGTGTGNGDMLGPASSVDSEMALFSGTGGKTLKRSTLTGIIKATAGVQSTATAGTDYAPATSGTAILKGNGAGAFNNAVAGTDYLAPPSGTAILKANSGGALTNASAGTDYLAPNGNGSQLTGLTKSMVGLGNVDNTSDTNKPISTSQQTALDLKAPLANPSFTGNVLLTLLGNENFTIDAQTNQRQMTLGVFRINHMAGITGSRPISLNINANGYADTHAIAVNYITGNTSVGSENHGLDFSVDVSNSTAGEIAALSVTKSGVGNATVTAVEVYPGVNVIEHSVGSNTYADSNFTYSGAAYTDRTVAFSSSSTNVQIFTAVNDYVYIGHSTKFEIINIVLNIVASGTGIVPTFEYSDGANSWAFFYPGDTTNGFRQNGTISIPDLASWVTRTVNGVSAKFWIRIRRTAATLVTPPTESTIGITITDKFYWDANGMLDISKITIKNLQTFSNVANAVSGGLTLGQVFKDTQGNLMIV